MSFSVEWDLRYKENTHLSIWPWSDLVSYVMRYARPQGKECRVLELGGGAGANIPFFQWLGVDYYGIDGSKTMIAQLKQRFPELQQHFFAGDFTKELPFDDEFDLVIDRASLTHNVTKDIKNGLELVYGKLKWGGKYIGIDWFSTMHSSFAMGSATDDVFTRCNYTEGQFAKVRNVHFSDEEHLGNLFCNFEIEIMEHKIIEKVRPIDPHVFASWNLVVRKECD